MRYIIPFVLFFFIYQAETFGQRKLRSWRIIDKLELIGRCASPSFLMNFNFPIGSEKGKFYMNCYFDTSYCRLTNESKQNQLQAMAYFIQEYAFKDSMQHYDSVLIFISSLDSGVSCGYGFVSTIDNYRPLPTEVKIRRLLRLLPFPAVLKPDMSTPNRLMIEIEFDKGYGVLLQDLPDAIALEYYLSNIGVLLYDFILRPTNMKEYDKLIIACKRDGNVFKLSTRDFRDEKFTDMYDSDIFTAPGTEMIKFIPSINVEKFK